MQAARTFFSIILMVMVASYAICSQAGEKSAGVIETEALHRLGALPSQDYPFGVAAPKEGFPRQWKNGRSADRKRIDGLSDYFFKDFASQDRQRFSANELSIDTIFPPRYLREFELSPVDHTASLSILKLHQGGTTAIYSATVKQDVPCARCEYKPYQMVNMLFVVSGGRVSDRLLVGYVAGSDLERRSRYFYIDQTGFIHLFDAYDDELDGNMQGEQHWRITAKGVFRRVGRGRPALVAQPDSSDMQIVYAGDRAVGNIGAATVETECERCHTIRRVDIFGNEVRVRIPVSIVSVNEKSWLIEDFTMEKILDQNVRTLQVRSIYSPEELRFEFPLSKGGKLSVAQRVGNVVYQHRIAKDDFVGIPAKKICRRKFMSGQEVGPQVIDLQDLAMFREGDCFECPASLATDRCIEMRELTQPFDWKAP